MLIIYGKLFGKQRSNWKWQTCFPTDIIIIMLWVEHKFDFYSHHVFIISFVLFIPMFVFVADNRKHIEIECEAGEIPFTKSNSNYSNKWCH